MTKFRELLSADAKKKLEKRFKISSPDKAPLDYKSVTKKRTLGPRRSFRKIAPAKEEPKMNWGLEIQNKYPGYFTNGELSTLNKYFIYFHSLVFENSPARDERDKHLIKVCKGENSAETTLEEVIVKYLKISGEYPVNVLITEENAEDKERRLQLGKASYNLNQNQLDREKTAYRNIPRTEEGYPRTEFGTRKDHKEMRARDWGDMKRRHRG